jgi:hypothetical protein
MHPEMRPVVTAVSSAPPKRGKRVKRSPKLRQPFDRRTRTGRRVQELVDIFRAQLGAEADHPLTMTAIRRAAEVTAMSEDMRARALRGDAVSADDALRMSRTSALLIRKLDLDRHRSAAPAPQALSEYLRNGDAGDENGTGPN